MDHPVAAVDELLLPEAHEHVAHRARVGLVEREARAAPVAGAADDLELLDDGVARLTHECPYPLHECLAPQIEARLALGGEPFLDHILCRDTGVIRPWEPLGGAAAHSLEAD